MNESGIFAEVVVGLPIDTVFSYAIPAILKSRVSKGKRVFVPFGRRKIIGYVVGFSDHVKEGLKIKEIINVLDEEEVISNEMLKLTRWIADYYLSSWGEVIKAALPNIDIRPRVKKHVRLKDEIIDKGVIENLIKRAPGQADILKVLRGGEVALTDLRKRVRGSPSSLRSLQDKGIITICNKEVMRTPHRYKDIQSTVQSGEEGGSDTSQDEWMDLDANQEKVIERITKGISEGGFSTFLLHGITGSGKTEIYARSIAKVLEMKKEAILLVPEISLTPQLVWRFKALFSDRVALLHSGISVGERYDEWRRIKSKKADIVVGTRSAIFAPFEDVGVIIVDEEHDTSYKQDESPRYNARDIAVVRGRLSGAVVILGSATPSIESFYNSKIGRYEYLSLPERIGKRAMPRIEVVDMKEEANKQLKQLKQFKRSNKEILSQRLKEAIEDRLLKKEQTFLFLNRRGTASFLQCRECGFVLMCPNCSLSLTYHGKIKKMQCHYCDYSISAPSTCPDCNGSRIDRFGIGTQRLEEIVKELFPTAVLARMDRDSTRVKHAHANILRSLKKGEIDILIGTQMIAKGHDFPGVTLVGIIHADASLNIPDFRSGERTFQLITQVAGRSGRGDREGEVIIQTYHPHHYIIQYASRYDFNGFYKGEAAFREELNYPPFAKMIGIMIESNSEKMAEKTSNEFGKMIERAIKTSNTHRSKGKDGIEMLGPARAFLYKIRNRYRRQIILKGKERVPLRSILYKGMQQFDKSKLSGGVRINIDIDPVHLV
ncbi:MAG: primosomal protein N' [Nitrospinota bacterium]